MRMATDRDEILPQRDPRVRENEAYLTVLLLSRVVTRLGTVPQVTSGTIEGLFASDLAFLQDLYRRINQEGHTQAAVTCPQCKHQFTVDLAGGPLGGAGRTRQTAASRRSRTWPVTATVRSERFLL